MFSLLERYAEMTDEDLYKVGNGLVVLVSGGAGSYGHGSRYLEKLGVGLTQTGIRVIAVTTAGAECQKGLERSGVELYLIALDLDIIRAENYLKVGKLAPLGRGLARLHTSWLFLNEVLKKCLSLSARTPQPIILHFLDYEYISLVFVLRKLRRTPKILPVVSIHPSDFSSNSLYPGDLYKRFVRILLRPTLRRECEVVCHGEWIADRLMAQFALQREQIMAVDYPSEGCDLRIDKQLARQLLACPQDKFIILWFGIIRKNKRVDIALKMMQHLANDCLLLIAGKPAEVSRDEILTLVEQYGIEDKVKLHLRYLNEEDIPKYFSAADVLVATHDASFSSASGVVSDARSYRLPVVVGDVGQLREYMRKYGAGITVEPNNPKAFAQAILRIASGEAPAVKAEDIEMAAQNLSWESFAAKHHRLYQEILKKRAACKTQKDPHPEQSLGPESRNIHGSRQSPE